MEPEKLRGISILAAGAVDSVKPRGIVIPAARAVAADAFLLTRNLSGTFSSAGSFPIRAPLTIDDDDDSGSVTDEHNSVGSDVSSYSKGLDSGTDDDGFGSISGDADDESELEDVVVGGVRVHSLRGGETGDGSDVSGGSVIYRPFAGDVEEETSVNNSSFEEESEISNEVSEGEVSEADGVVSMKAKVVIPRAVLSLDDDEFDEVLGSGDEEGSLVRVTKAPSDDEETEVGDRTLQLGDMGMVDEPECSDSVVGDVVSTEEEAVGMSYSDKLEDGLMSSVNIDEQSLGVPSGGSTDSMVENEESSIESSMGLGGTSKKLIEEGLSQRSSIKDDGGGSINEVDALMTEGDVEGVKDSAAELGETDKPECSGSITGELVSTEEDIVQAEFSGDGLVSFQTSLAVAPRDCNVKSEGNAVDTDRVSDESFSQVVEQGEGNGSISQESNDDSSSEVEQLMIPGEGCIGLGRRESEDEDTGNMIGESKEQCENDCAAVSELEKSECEGEPESGMSSESFHLSPTSDAVTTRNLEVAGGIDVVVSGCGSSDQKDEQEAENEGKQESEDTDRKLLLPDEDISSSLRSSFEIANENPENGEQISEQMNNQVHFQSDSERNEISVGIEETSLLSVEDVDRTMPEDSCVIADALMENETQMGQLIHNHTLMELDKYEETGDSREKHSDSTFKNYYEELSSDHSVELISDKVKKRVEKTKLLKEKLQKIIRKMDLSGENPAVTEVESKLNLAGEEHQTSLGLDYVSDETKLMLPEQEFPDDLDFSINVLVIGKTGVGKSATVNSIFGETKSPVGAFGVTTKSANYVVGNVGGVMIRVLDTPGLMSAATEERYNQDVLVKIKKSMRTFPVDVILYVDRIDENPDIHLLRIVTSSLGSSIWRNAIVVLTHAASDVPSSSSYNDFIAQRSSLMHQSIKQAVPEFSCVDRRKMPGIVLVENNMSSLCGNKTSESTCADWRLKLLILCCSVKIRSKAGSLQKKNTVVEKTGVFGSQLRSLTVLCSLWNVLLLGDSTGGDSHSHDDLEEKKKRLLDSYPEILWDEQSLECLEQEPEDEEKRRGRESEGSVLLRRVRTRRGRLGFQATKRLGIYLDASDLHTGFAIGDYRKHEEQQEGKMLMRIRGSMSVLGLVPVLMSVFTCVYGGKTI